VKPIAEWGQKYRASAGTAATSWASGIQNTDKDQAALAVAAIPRMQANFNDAVTSGRVQRGLTRRGTTYWKSRSASATSNYSNGISRGADNYDAAAQKLGPAIQTAVANLPPRGDVNANIERVRALALYLHDRKGTLGAA
jgi:hypothetical protein